MSDDEGPGTDESAPLGGSEERPGLADVFGLFDLEGAGMAGGAPKRDLPTHPSFFGLGKFALGLYCMGMGPSVWDVRGLETCEARLVSNPSGLELVWWNPLGDFP